MRSVGVSVNDTVAASGDCRSVIALWDLTNLALQNISVMPHDPNVELNAIMDMSFDPSHASIFYVFQRSGHLSLWDTRTSRLRQWHTKCHNHRASFLKVSQDSTHLVTAARGNEIKMWDLRSISGSDSVQGYLQIYNQHVSEKLALGIDFLNYERFLVTGSDSFYAVIYDTLTGEKVQQVSLGPGQVETVCALNPDDLSFYTIFMNGKYLGLVDSEGTTIQHDYTSAEQIKALYSKEAWDEVLSRNVDRLLEASRAAQQTVAINYDEMLAIVRDSDLAMCKKLLNDLTEQYEANIQATTPQLVRAFQAFYTRQSSPTPDSKEEEREISGAQTQPRVYMERTTLCPVQSAWPAY